MADQELSIFKDEEAVAAPEPEAQADDPVVDTPAEPQLEEPQAEAVETGEVEAAPPVAELEKESPHVPLTAILDEREKRQAAERQAQELEARLMQMQQQSAPPQQAPDMLDDPDGYNQFVQTQVNAAIQDVKLNQSEDMARYVHGDETVDAAFQAFRQAADQATYQSIMAKRSPWMEVVNWHKDQQFRQEVGNDPEAWRNAERERIRQELMAEIKPAVTPAAPPPPSLSKAGASGPTPTPAMNVPPTLNGLFNG